MVFYTPLKCRTVRTKCGPGSTEWDFSEIIHPKCLARIRIGSKVLMKKITTECSHINTCFTPLALTLNISPNQWSYVDNGGSEVVFWKRVWNSETDYQDYIVNDHYLEEAELSSYPDYDEPVLDKNVVCRLIDDGWIDASEDTIHSQAKYRGYVRHTSDGTPQELYRIRLGGLVLMDKRTNLPVLATHMKQDMYKTTNDSYIRMLYYGSDFKSYENGPQEFPFWNQDSNELHSPYYYWHPADPDSVDDFEDTKMIHGEPDPIEGNGHILKILDEYDNEEEDEEDGEEEDGEEEDGEEEELKTPREYHDIDENDLLISSDEEIRRDFDGKLYTKNEFEKYYGGLKEWKQCSHKKWRKRTLILYAMKYDISDDVKKILAEVLLEI
tara:strand:+ start:998 stop:2146 length:1149 start_codon:yes stop_codon:yes gene_type:complete